MSYRHVSAMLNEAVWFLNCRPGKIYVDGTLGGAGHAKAICEKIIPGGLLIGIDQDRDSVTHAAGVLAPYGDNVRLFHDNFTNLARILKQLSIVSVDGIILDLGVSLHQIESSGRGFSFMRDEPLDMRMNAASEPTARDLVNTLAEEELEAIFKKFGEERWSRPIARKIVHYRKRETIRSSRQLAQIICETVHPRNRRHQRIHPATRVFMALRIAVNKELEALDAFMGQVIPLLNKGGRLCVLSFHSLEDRIVKTWFKKYEKGCICPTNQPVCVCMQKSAVRVLTKKVMRASREEIASNPMARSTRLRAVEKI